MRTTIAALSIAALAAGTGMALAQSAGPGGPGGGPMDDGHMGGPMGRHHGPMQQLSKDDRGTLVDAKVAAVKAAMKFTPDQEKLWQPVEQLMRKHMDEMGARMDERRAERQARMSGDDKADKSSDFAERLDRRAQLAAQHAQHLKDMADAVKPLWASLDERQKKLFPIVMRPAGPRMAGGGWRGHHGRM